MRELGPSISPSELFRQLEALKTAVKARDDFIAIAGHELRNPLATMLLCLDYLRLAVAKTGSPPLITQALDPLERAIRTFSSRATTLLDVARLNSEKLPLELECIDIGTLVRDIASDAATELHTAGCELRIDTPRDINGFWDPMALRQVIGNLLSNAIKYGAGKPIDLTIVATSQTVLMRVRDRGVGISEEDQQRMFQKFERAVRRSEYGGFGLGLWISYQIIKAHGGEIEVRSIPGEGSEFTVRLPRDARGKDGTSG